LLVRCGDLHRNTNMLVFSEQKREILVDFVDLLLDSLLALWDTSQPSCAGHLLNCGLKSPYALRFYEYTANCGPARCRDERQACCANAITLFL
jgi:hypothetical protein